MGNQLIKEQIIEILESDYCDGGPTLGSIADKIENLVNQEVERRIKERMPSNFDIVTATSKWVEEKPERGYCKFGFIEGIVWLMSRLTCSEKPNNSQKTEGGAK